MGSAPIPETQDKIIKPLKEFYTTLACRSKHAQKTKMSMHFKNGRRRGGGISKTEKATGTNEREERGKGQRKNRGKKITGNKGMTSSSVPCYIRAE